MEEKVLYKYNYSVIYNRNIYIGSTIASKDDSGNYLLMPNTTTKKPELVDGYIPAWNGFGWENIEDISKKVFYDKETKQIVKEIKYYDMDKVTDIKPLFKYSYFDDLKNEWVVDTDKLKKEIYNSIVNNLKLIESVFVNIRDSDIEFNCCENSVNSIKSILEYISISGNKEIPFRLYNNSFMIFSEEEYKKIYEIVFNNYQDNLKNKWKIKDELNYIEDVKEIYDYAKKYNIDVFLKDENGNSVNPFVDEIDNEEIQIPKKQKKVYYGMNFENLPDIISKDEYIESIYPNKEENV